MKKLIIIGASGHGKVVADIARKCGYEEIVFLDNNPQIKSCSGYPVLGSDAMVDSLEGDVFIAIGNASVREKLMNRDISRNYPVLMHPSAVVAEDVEIGEGTVIMAGAVINSGAKVYKGCIVNTSSSIDHDCVIDNFVHVAVGAHLCGNVEVGDRTWIGAGATIINNIKICGGCMIGAGAVVINNIDKPGTYIGVPAYIKKES